MNLKETVEHDMPDEVMYMDYLVLDPKDDHILLEAKSPLIHSFMKSKAVGPALESRWGGKFFKVNLSKMHIPGNANFKDVGGHIVRDSGSGLIANVSWLRSVDLADGCSIKIPDVLAMADLEAYMNITTDILRNFYLQNLRKAVLRARMGERFE